MVRALCGAAGVLGAQRPPALARAGRVLALGGLLGQASLVPLAVAAAAEAKGAAAAGRGSATPASTKAAVVNPPDDEAPRLALRRSRLDNGLRVVLHRDTSLPTVAIGIAYAVGWRHESNGEQGFARWLQHAMFGGSGNVAAGEHARWIREHGGSHAAWTSADRTLFVDVLPAHALSVGLWLEADRLKSLELSTAELTWQARLLELELAREAREPGGRGARELRALVFQQTSQPTPPSATGAFVPGGSLSSPPGSEQLLPALQAFHQRYYAPNNAVLTLVGNFEVLDALNLVHTYFADAEPVELRPAPEAQPAEQTQPRRLVVQAQVGEGPALWQGWSIPGVRTAEHDALELAGVILGKGVGSRLHQLLVQEKAVAREVSVWTDGARGPDLFGVQVQLREGVDPEQASRLVLTQIAALGRFGPSASELQRAQRLLATSTWQRLDGNAARARALCDAELFAHDARVLEADLERFGKVSREDVQRAVARHLRPPRRSDVLMQARGR